MSEQLQDRLDEIRFWHKEGIYTAVDPVYVVKKAAGHVATLLSIIDNLGRLD